jgi:hypothetical protein
MSSREAHGTLASLGPNYYWKLKFVYVTYIFAGGNKKKTYKKIVTCWFSAKKKKSNASTK